VTDDGTDGPSQHGPTRAAATISAWNALSRVTGLVRVMAVAGALGATFLGNTYQSANLVSNVLFDLLAAGLLSAPLVPMVVGLLMEERRAEADRLLGALLGMSAVLLGVVALAGALAGRWLVSMLLAGAPIEVRPEAIRLGAFLLWFFLPQVVLYAVGAISTAALHAERRFSAAAAAPVANNVIVTVTMVAFAVSRHGDRPGLDLAVGQRWLLAVGTTAGVLAMSAIPWLAARRTGFRFLPRWDLRAPGLARLVRQGGWAALLVSSNQLLVAATLVLANRVEGGVVAYQTAMAFFLLPFALLAHPVITALFPSMAARAHGGDAEGFARESTDGARALVFLLLPATALLVALGSPALRVFRFGALDAQGARLVAQVLAAYALGLLGYAGLNFGTRAFVALGDFRTPALVGASVAVGGVATMLLVASRTHGSSAVVGLGLATSAVTVVGAATLLALLGRRLGRAVAVASSVARGSVGAAALGYAAWLASRTQTGSGRPAAAAGLGLGLLAAAVVGVAVQWALRSPELEWAVRAVRGRTA
jgi:putative peptidoglycan lipid II flippase